MIPDNHKNPPIQIAHAELERYDEGAFKSKCMRCEKGILLVRRLQDYPYTLLPDDNCIACGQTYVYLDIERLRNLGDPK